MYDRSPCVNRGGSPQLDLPPDVSSHAREEQELVLLVVVQERIAGELTVSWAQLPPSAGMHPPNPKDYRLDRCYMAAPTLWNLASPPNVTDRRGKGALFVWRVRGTISKYDHDYHTHTSFVCMTHTGILVRDGTRSVSIIFASLKWSVRFSCEVY